jgi:hypothetical protein
MEREKEKSLLVYRRVENVIFWISFLIIIAVIAVLVLMSIVMIANTRVH